MSVSTLPWAKDTPPEGRKFRYPRYVVFVGYQPLIAVWQDRARGTGYMWRPLWRAPTNQEHLLAMNHKFGRMLFHLKWDSLR